MKKYLSIKAVASSLAIIVASALQSASAQEATPSINVSGQGSVAVVPDAFSLTLIIEEKGETVSKLNQRVASEMQTVVKFLMDNGIEENHIQSMQISLNPNYESTPEGRQQSGFVLSREIQVTDTHLTQYDRIIDGALSRGVDRIQNFQFVASKQSHAYEQALINAVKDARSRASLLAEQLEVKMGNVLSVSESSNGYAMPRLRMEMKADALSPSMPGQQMIEAHVNVSFAIDN